MVLKNKFLLYFFLAIYTSRSSLNYSFYIKVKRDSPVWYFCDTFTYSETGWRWNGQSRGVFSICTEATLPELWGGSLQAPLLHPRCPLHWFPSCKGLAWDEWTRTPWPSPPPGFGAFWIALKRKDKHYDYSWPGVSQQNLQFTGTPQVKSRSVGIIALDFLFSSLKQAKLFTNQIQQKYWRRNPV